MNNDSDNITAIGVEEAEQAYKDCLAVEASNNNNTFPTAITPNSPETSGHYMTKAVGRRAALECLDTLLLQEGNIQNLRVALQDQFNRDPAVFFKQYVMPLLPREARIQGETGGTQINIVMVEAPQGDLSNTNKDGNVVDCET